MANLKKGSAKCGNDFSFQKKYLFTKEECEESLEIINKLKNSIKKLRDKNLCLTDLSAIYEFYTLCAKMRNKLRYWSYCGSFQIEVNKIQTLSKLLEVVSKGKDNSKK